MLVLAGASVLTRSKTRFEPPEVDADLVSDLLDIWLNRAGRIPYVPKTTGNVSQTEFAGGGIRIPNVGEEPISEEPTKSSCWETMGQRLLRLEIGAFSAYTRATSATATTVSALSETLRRRTRDERLSRLSPQGRATYERIKKLREQIGLIDFDVVDTLRELRTNG